MMSHSIPDRKISETLMNFVKPLLEKVDENTTKNQIEKGIQLAVTVWNAVVLDRLRENNTFKDSLRKKVTEDIPQGSELIEMLINRKHKYFSEDIRMITNFEVFYKKGYLNISATGTLDEKILESIKKH